MSELGGGGGVRHCIRLSARILIDCSVWIDVGARVGVRVAVGEGDGDGVGFGFGCGFRFAFAFGGCLCEVDFLVDFVDFLGLGLEFGLGLGLGLGLGPSLRSVSVSGGFDVVFGSICRSIFI